MSEKDRIGPVSLDVECFRDWFYVCAIETRPDGSERVHEFEMVGPDARFSEEDTGRLFDLLTEAEEIATFNGHGYDMPMIRAATRDGKSAAELHSLSEDIICGSERPRRVHLKNAPERHVDVRTYIGRHVSLKEACVRSDFPVLDSLPFDPQEKVADDPEKLERLRFYCQNDCRATAHLRTLCEPDVSLRQWLNDHYGSDRTGGYIGRQDSQIAEHILTRGSPRRFKKKRFDRDFSNVSTTFRYEAPDYVKGTPHKPVDDLIKTWEATELSASGRDLRFLDDVPKEIHLGGLEVSIGVGGLHSVHREPCQAVTNDEYFVAEYDVPSYYPRLILLSGLVPERVPDFPDRYGGVVDQRLLAKQEGRHHEANALKVAVNGCFGKLNFPPSDLYSPPLFAHVTLTGQAAVLNLIGDLQEAGAEVIHANTDGVVVRAPKAIEKQVDGAAKAWCDHSGFGLERTNYDAFFLRDVNNYVAITGDGKKVKRKGAYQAAFGRAGLNRKASARVCADAAVKWVTDGEDPMAHIDRCEDVNRFVVSAKSTSGIRAGNEALGNVARWFVTTDESRPPLMSGINRTVPGGDRGAVLCDRLPKRLPDNLDRSWYYEETGKLLSGLGESIGLDMGKQPDMFARGDGATGIRSVAAEPRHESGRSAAPAPLGR